VNVEEKKKTLLGFKTRKQKNAVYRTRGAPVAKDQRRNRKKSQPKVDDLKVPVQFPKISFPVAFKDARISSFESFSPPDTSAAPHLF